MNRIPFKTDELMPWADLQMCFNNMRNLVVKVDGKEYTGEALLCEEDGTVTIEFGAKPTEKPKKKPKNKIGTGKKVGLVESLQNQDPRLMHQS